MSRIGKEPIKIPSNVTVSFNDHNFVTVKGAKGELVRKIHPDMELSIDDGLMNVVRPSEQKRHKALHGLSRSLINNMIEGVTNGYQVVLELHGIGYRASNKGQLLTLALGYSHPIIFYIPDELSVTTTAEKGQVPSIILEGMNKELIGQIASKLKSLRKTEPYKGKGVRFKGEYVRRKEGKSAGK